MKIKLFILFIVILILSVGGLGVYLSKASSSSDLDGFAQCLSASGAEFYGTFWCTHCQNQKKMFGSAKKFLPYIECSSADGQEQTQVCKDKKIEGYPTWIFKDGSQLSGEQSLQTLSEKTSCPLPQ